VRVGGPIDPASTWALLRGKVLDKRAA
jgi:hypothetical protein